MLAGNFLGDVGRRVLVKLAEQGVLFNGVVTDQLKTKDSLAAADLGAIEKYVLIRPQFVFAVPLFTIHLKSLSPCFPILFLFDDNDDNNCRKGAEKVREVGQRIGYENLSDDDIRIIHYVGKIVAIRAAVLTSTREFSASDVSASYADFAAWWAPYLSISYFIALAKHKQKRKRSINAR